jgi:hypothetical protein
LITPPPSPSCIPSCLTHLSSSSISFFPPLPPSHLRLCPSCWCCAHVCARSATGICTTSTRQPHEIDLTYDAPAWELFAATKGAHYHDKGSKRYKQIMNHRQATSCIRNGRCSKLAAWWSPRTVLQLELLVAYSTLRCALALL